MSGDIPFFLKAMGSYIRWVAIHYFARMIKLRFIGAVTVCFLLAELKAQEFQSNIKVGISITPSITHVWEGRSYMFENKGAISYRASGDLIIPVSKKISFITGVELLSSHYHYSHTWAFSKEGEYIDHDYRELSVGLPLLCRIKFNSQRKFHFQSEFGVHGRRLISLTGVYRVFEEHQFVYERQLEEHRNSDTKTYRIAAQIGIGFSGDLGEKAFSILPVFEFPLSGLYYVQPPIWPRSNFVKALAYGLKVGISW